MTRLEDRQILIHYIAEARANGARQAPARVLAGVINSIGCGAVASGPRSSPVR
jgi:hypothetical protein